MAPPRSLTWLALPTLLAAALTLGCAHFPGAVEKPKVDPLGFSVQSVGLSGLRGTVHLSVLNPNSFGLPLRRATFRVGVGGAEAASGEIDLPLNIPAKGTAPVDASIEVNALSAAQVIANYGAGERHYTLRGTLYFSTRLGEISVEVQSQGEIGNPPMAMLSR